MARKKPSVNPLFPAALEVQRFFKKHRWRFCIIGALAAIRWGEARTTQDVDLTLITSLGKELEVIDKVLDAFEERIPNAREFAHRNRVILCTASNGVAIDISLAAPGHEELIVSRALSVKYAPGYSLLTASAEDVIVLKAFADRGQDWGDIRGIIAVQGNKLDWNQIVRDLTGLCELKEDSTPLEKLEKLRQRVYRALDDKKSGDQS
jgi:hypothetical protein